MEQDAKQLQNWELLIRLDERQRAEERRVNWLIGDLNGRLLRVEARPLSPLPQLGNWGWFKISLAAALMLGVWLQTGDPKAALRAAGAPFAMQ